MLKLLHAVCDKSMDHVQCSVRRVVWCVVCVCVCVCVW